MNVYGDEARVYKMADLVFDIFIPNGTPTQTYIKRTSEGNEGKLADALDIPKMVISISGPSKTGKTALINTCISEDRIIPVSGQSVKSPTDLWKTVIRWIGGPEEIEKISGRTISGDLSAKATAESGLILAKLSAEGELSAGAELSSETSRKIGVELYESVIKEIGGSDYVVFLDDFHYIPRQAQVEIARSIKAISERGVRVCIASAPHKSEDISRANDELTGRLISLKSDYWTVAELEAIGNAGFPKLGVDVAPGVIKRLATESLGSPQLMQSLCLNLCLEKGIRNKQAMLTRTDISERDITRALERTVLQADYSSTVERLHIGAKERGTQRKEFVFTDGSKGDVYRSILLALMENPPRLSFNYDEIMRRIKIISVDEAPGGSSVQLALKQMDGLAKGINRDKPHIEWDGDKVEIISPYFMFYLRSSQILSRIDKNKAGMV